MKFQNKLIALGMVAIATIGSLILENNRINATKNKNLDRLETKLASLSEGTQRWDKMNVLALKTLASQPNIQGMIAEEQRPALQQLISNYQHFYLAFTLNTEGINVARSDNNAPKDYSDRSYYRDILLGKPIAYQTLIGRSNQQPTLCMAAPIKQIQVLVGIATVCSNFENLSREIGDLKFDRTGSVMLVDRDGFLIAHPNSSYLRQELKNMRDFPPIKNVLEGREGKFDWQNPEGEKWVAFADRLSNGWGIVVLQAEAELLPERQYQIAIAIAGLTLSALLMLLGSRSKKSFSKEKIINKSNKDRDNNLPKSPINNPALDRSFIPRNEQQKKLKINEIVPNYKKNIAPTILLMHRKQERLEFYTKILLNMGCSVDTCTSEETGFKKAEERDFDLIILQISFSDLNDNELVKKWQKFSGDEIPIIALCSRINLVKNPEFFLQFDNVINDLFDKEELKELLNKYLSLTKVIELPR